MGRPKAWLPFGDEVLLQRVVRILQTVFDPIVVVAAPDQELPVLPDSVVVARDDREYLGPLNGLAVGLAFGRADARPVPTNSGSPAVRSACRRETNVLWSGGPGAGRWVVARACWDSAPEPAELFLSPG